MAEFTRIFERVCAARANVAFDPPCSSSSSTTGTGRETFRCAAAIREISIQQALSLAEYLDQPRELTPELLDAACSGYFVHDQAPVV